MMAQGNVETGQAKSGKAGKVVLQLLLGAISGAVAMGGSLFLLERYDGLLDRTDVVFALGTAVVYLLMGLVVGIISDLMYVWIDPRIDFERRG